MILKLGKMPVVTFDDCILRSCIRDDLAKTTVARPTKSGTCPQFIDGYGGKAGLGD